MPLWLWWLQQFQGMLVGLVGFAGVILTLVMNDLLARRHREASFVMERQALRTALAQELQVLRDMYHSNALACLKAQQKLSPPLAHAAFDVPIYEMTDVYDRSTARLGILSSPELARVMRAYMLHRQMRHRIVALLAEPQSVTSSSARVPARHGALLRTMCESMVPEVNAAIVALSPDERAGRRDAA